MYSPPKLELSVARDFKFAADTEKRKSFPKKQVEARSGCISNPISYSDGLNMLL